MNELKFDNDLLFQLYKLFRPKTELTSIRPTDTFYVAFSMHNAVVATTEGVHWSIGPDGVANTWNLPLGDDFAYWHLEYSVADLRRVPLGNFISPHKLVRRFGSRLEQNFDLLLHSLVKAKILTPEEYVEERKAR